MIQVITLVLVIIILAAVCIIGVFLWGLFDAITDEKEGE